MRRRTLVVGYSGVNLAETVYRIPAPGDTVPSDGTYTFSPGGNGAVSAVTFARLGSDCIICTKMGNDSNAQKLMRMFEREKIDTRFAVCDRRYVTSFSTTIIEKSQKPRTIVYEGAAPFLEVSEIESALTSYPDAMYLQMNISEESVIESIRMANKNDIPVFIDAVGASADFPLDLLGNIEIFSPNENETELLSGIRPINADASLRACIKLSSMIKAKYIVLKLGERGSYVYDGIYFHIIPHIPVPVADTLGAGDVYTAALTYCYMQTSDIVAAGKFANYAATLSVTKPGGYASIPTLEQIKLFSQKINDK